VTGDDDDPPPLHDESASARTQRTGLEKKRTPDPFRHSPLLPRAADSPQRKFYPFSGKTRPDLPSAARALPG
jgi:hypothetical protein